jgi:hypothetical protein
LRDAKDIAVVAPYQLLKGLNIAALGRVNQSHLINNWLT